jgi:lysophospholipase L1-like esterase
MYMMRMFRRQHLLSILPLALVLTLGQAKAHAQAQDHWVGTWAASPYAEKNSSGKLNQDDTTGVTLREIVHISIGGPAVRVVLTNEFGVEPLTIDAASIALRGEGSSITSATPLTFGGRASVIIPPGALIVSDAAPLKVAPFSDLAVSIFLPDQPVTQISYHGAAYQTNYRVPGNSVTAPTLTAAKEFYSWLFLKGVDVQTEGSSSSIVAFGDSITDGAHSTRDANARWPDVLAKRLAADKKTSHIGVLNEGIGGNRILHDGTGPSALARFDRDVIAQAGVRYVIVLEAINDIGHAEDPKRPFDVITAEDLINGFKQMALRAHTHGIKIYGATLTPYVGAGYSSPAGEEMRKAVNQWIRTSKDLDGFIDFDKVTLDPAKPNTFLPAADSGDHLHPKDAGYKMMGDSIDLKLFTK